MLVNILLKFVHVVKSLMMNFCKYRKMINFIGRKKKDNTRIIQFEYSSYKHNLSNFSKQFVLLCLILHYHFIYFCGQFRIVFFEILADDIWQRWRLESGTSDVAPVYY